MQGMKTNGGGGGGTLARPIAPRPTAPVKGTAIPTRSPGGMRATPVVTKTNGGTVTTRNPFAGNPIAGPLAAKVIAQATASQQRLGTPQVTTRAPLGNQTGTTGPARICPAWGCGGAPVMRKPASPVSPISTPPAAGPPSGGALITNNPIAPAPTTGGNVSEHVAIQTPSSLGLATIPPAGTPPSMTVGNAAPPLPDTGSISFGGPLFTLSGFQMNSTTMLLILGGGLVLFFLMASK